VPCGRFSLQEKISYLISVKITTNQSRLVLISTFRNEKKKKRKKVDLWCFGFLFFQVCVEIVGFLGFVLWISGVFSSDDDDDDDDDDSLASWSFRFGCSNNFLLLGVCLFVAGDFGFESGSKKTRQWDNTGQFFGLLAGPKDKVFSLFFEFFF